MSTVKRPVKHLLRVLLKCRFFQVLNHYYSFCQTRRYQGMASTRELLLMLRNLAVSAPTSLPPHSVDVYRSMLTALAAHPHELAIVPLRELLDGRKREDIANVYLRHDVDFFPSGLEALCSIEAEFGCASSIYVLVAREKFFYSPYDITEFRWLVDKLRFQGFEIGLHTVAYATQVGSMLDCFSREIERFERALGYLPETFTFHGWPGCGHDRQAKRSLFSEKLLEHRDRFTSFTGKMSDYFLNPVIGISDSGVPWPGTSREIRHFYPGEIVCVLNHPCYWSEEGITSARNQGYGVSDQKIGVKHKEI